MARIALACLSYGTVRRAVARLQVRATASRPITPEECACAVVRATHVLPGSTCLARAVAAEALLRRDGHVPEVNFGVRLDEARRLTAHAWVILQGVVVIGGEEAAGYARMQFPST